MHLHDPFFVVSHTAGFTTLENVVLIMTDLRNILFEVKMIVSMDLLENR